MGKLIYIMVKIKKATFVETSIIKSDIFFIKGDQYTIVYLKSKKTDIEYIEVQIILAITGEYKYLVAVLRRIFI